MKKNEIQEIVSNFNEETIVKALENLREKKFPLIKTQDLFDPGEEIEVGKENCVALEDLGSLERIIGRSNLLPASFLEEGAITQKAVARVVFKEGGNPLATGFLVSPSLFLTNNHVIPSKSNAKRLNVQFNYQNDIAGNPLPMDEYTFDPDDVFYTNRSLDYTLVRINQKCDIRFLHQNFFSQNSINANSEFTPNPSDTSGVKPDIDLFNMFNRNWRYNLTSVCNVPGQKWGSLRLKRTATYSVNQFLNIIQHPAGRKKEIAIQENKITNIYINKVRYTTDTEPGSSGSPVFNNLWDLVALHHSAGEKDANNDQWKNNQGIRIDKIVEDLNSHYDGTTTGRSILRELGIL